MSICCAKRLYLSTPIFYVNAGPHIGHLYTSILADCLARYEIMLERQVFLTTGTDEHGKKVENAAQAKNLSTPEYCDIISKQFRTMCDKFDVNYNVFIRTTESKHIQAVHHFWNLLQSKDHIYLGKYSGWYCLSDESFLNQSDLIETKDEYGKNIKVSSISGHPVEWTEENNYKFRLSNFENDLKYWLKTNPIKPIKFHDILLRWIEEGHCKQDLSISRPSNRVPWGIPTPCDQSHQVYVWLDALVNYLTSLDYPNERFRQLWPPHIQIIGKDILKFHALYWPAFLIAAGLEPPKCLLVHSHWLVNNEKMSKSKGNVIDPEETAKIFTRDGLRYFLLREAVPHSDANYNQERIIKVLNNELADTFGNLISRCTGKIINPNNEYPDPAIYANYINSETAIALRKKLETVGEEANKHYQQFELHYVVDNVMSVLRHANQMVDHHKPWKLVKNSDPESAKELKSVVSLALESSRIAALILYPIVPKLSNNLLDYFSVPRSERYWGNTVPLYCNNKSCPVKLNQGNLMLFKRIKFE